MQCLYCGADMPVNGLACPACGKRPPVYGAPDGFSFDRQRGQYCRQSSAGILWFDPFTGQYEKEPVPVPPEPDFEVRQTDQPVPDGFSLDEASGLYRMDDRNGTHWYDPLTGLMETQGIRPLESAYALPEGFVADPASGLAYRAEKAQVQGGREAVEVPVTWFDPATGAYAQVLYAAGAGAPPAPVQSRRRAPNGVLAACAAVLVGGLAWAFLAGPLAGVADSLLGSQTSAPSAGASASKPPQSQPSPGAPVQDGNVEETRPGDGEAEELPNGPVTFSETALDAAIRAWLNRPEGEILPSDLEKITTFSLSYDESYSEVGIRFWGNGDYQLDVFFYPTQDMPQSFEDFDLFPHIRELDIYYNPALDLNSLTGMERVPELSLLNCGITDVSPLTGMSQLKNLTLADNPDLTDISPLAGMNLEFLNIVETSVSDISALAGMDSLKYIDLMRCPVYDLSPLSALPNLEYVSLPAAAWRYLAPVAHVENIMFDTYPSNKLPRPEGAHPAMNCMALLTRQGVEIGEFDHRDDEYGYYHPTEVAYYAPNSEERLIDSSPDGVYVALTETLEGDYVMSTEYYGLLISTQAMLGVPSVTAEELKRNHCGGKLLIEDGGNPYLIIEGVKYELVQGGSAFMVTTVEE